MSYLLNDVNGGYSNSTDTDPDPDPDPDSNKRPYEDEISERILHVPAGHHYLILYPNIETMRKIYASYIKRQLEEQPGSVILFLPYYDTTEKVRQVLESMGIKVKQHEKEGTIVIIDIVKVVEDPFSEVPDIQRLTALTRRIENQYKDKTIFVVADMSVFHHLNRSKELLEYEKTLHKDLKIERWKELCFYNERDFDVMFTEDQAKELLEYHKDRVITVQATKV
jgi:KaiC/GvpD/RAD55 family RecA-like ATPase